MKAAKDGKGEGNKQQQQQAGPALFPRLHVAETKQMGPRAPPRNKMALYEQFTIPSHRFRSSPVPLPSSSSTQNSINPSMSPALVPLFPSQMQGGSYDGRYSYVPCYMNPMSPALAYVPSMNAGHQGAAAGQVSTNGTSSTVVDGDIEMQRVPFVTEGSLPTHSKNGKVCNNDCTVPTYSGGTQTSSQRRSSLTVSQSQEAASRGHRHPSKKARDSGKEKRFNREMPGGGSEQPQFHQKERNVDGMSSDQTEVLSEQNGGLSELNGGLSWHGTGSVTASVDENDNAREHDIEQRDADVDVHLQGSDLQDRDRDAAQQLQPSLATAPKGVQEAERLRGQSEENHHHSSEASENVSGEVSEQRGQGSSGEESESSILDYVPVENVTPRDVMSAIGQQEFWRARKAILRQQKMFSVQVFELHRLTDVQRQMARCPSLILEADTEKVEEQEQEEEEEDQQQQVPGPAPVTPVPPHVPELPAKFVEGNNGIKCNTNPLVMMEAPKLMYPIPFPHHQQGFLPGQPWQAAAPYTGMEQGAQMAPSYMYLPHPPPCPPAYGYHHPLMHPNIMMYEQNRVQHAQMMPLWLPQREFSYGSGAMGPGSAWYSAPPHLPVMGSTQQGGTLAPSSNYSHPLVRPESLGASSQMHANNLTGKQGGAQTHKAAARAQDDNGWAKGWGTYQGHVKQREEPKQGGEREGAQLHGQQHSEIQVAVTGGGTGEVELKQPYEGTVSDPLPLFPLSPAPSRRIPPHRGVIKVVPRAVLATPESTAGILLSIQQERQQE